MNDTDYDTDYHKSFEDLLFEVDLMRPDDLTTDEQIMWDFLIYSVFLIPVGIVGFLLNCVSIVVLSRPQMHCSANFLLLSIACCDCLVILTEHLTHSPMALYNYKKSRLLFTFIIKWYAYIYKLMHPLNHISKMVSVYLTLAVTLERFVAVCHPLHVRSLCTYGRARLCVLLTVLFSALFNLPRFWEFDIVEEFPGVFLPQHSELERNPRYTICKYWLNLIVTFLIPFFLFITINGLIYRKIRIINRARQDLSREEINMTTMMMCMNVEYMLCELLPMVNLVMLIKYYEIKQSVLAAHVTVILNSSENFFIYMIFGAKFRQQFFKTFSYRVKCKRSTTI